MAEGPTPRRVAQDLELGLLDQRFPDAVLNPSRDPHSPPLIFKHHMLEESSRQSSITSMTHLLRPATPLPTSSGLTSRTISVTDIPSAFKEKVYLPESRPSTPSRPLLAHKQEASTEFYPVSAEALIPLPRPPKDAPPVKKEKTSLWIRSRIWFNTYRKFFTFVTILNGVAVVLALTGHFPYARKYPGALVLGNLTAAILVRNELFGRFLYLVLNTLFAKWAPLSIRLAITSILQHLGGIHSGCALAGCVWLIINIVDNFIHHSSYHASILATGTITSIAIIVSILAALPWVRNNHHNVFERWHRFIGWVGLASTWIFVILGDLWDSTSMQFNTTPMRVFGSQAFWFALCMTIFVILPWCFVRRVRVEVEIPSPKVAVLKFDRGMQQGLLGRISRSAVKEYHAFGIISAGTQSNAHYMICGVQGDFTKSLVADPPSHIWTRELKFAGVSNTSTLYKRGIRICTGTGLGAALSTCIQSPNWFLIWVGSDMEKTFGPTISALIHDNLGPERVLLWDSKARGGRPNTMKILKEVYKTWNAEVVFITSNYEGNKEMMEGCKEVGIPAFGTLWDF